MFQYYMHIEWNSTKDKYTATLPDIPGINGHGNTYDEAAHHCRKILDKLIALAKECDEPSPEKDRGYLGWLSRQKEACNELMGKGYYKFASDWLGEHNGNEDGMLDAWMSNGQKAAFLEEISRENETNPTAKVTALEDRQKKIIATLRDIIDIEEEDEKKFDALDERCNDLDERLKKLERYNQE